MDAPVDLMTMLRSMRAKHGAKYVRSMFVLANLYFQLKDKLHSDDEKTADDALEALCSLGHALDLEQDDFLSFMEIVHRTPTALLPNPSDIGSWLADDEV